MVIILYVHIYVTCYIVVSKARCQNFSTSLLLSILKDFNNLLTMAIEISFSFISIKQRFTVGLLLHIKTLQPLKTAHASC